MSLTPYPTLRLKLTMPQALKLQFLPAIPGSNAAAAAAAAEAAAAAAIAAANTAVAATANKVDRTGDVMSGFLTLNADPTAVLHAATKQYVDAHSGGSLALAASQLAGRGASSGTGTPEAITLGTNLSMTGTTLNATGGGGGAPLGAEYITSTSDATLTSERVLTDTATITWDRTTAGQIKANTAAGGGNVSNSGTPTVDQVGVWVTATTIKGIGGTADQVLRINSAGTTPAFGTIDLTKAAAVTGQLRAASFPILTGDVTTAGGALATTIANDAVTYAKMQNVSAASLLIGRGSAAGAGDPQEITIGTGLSMTGTTLSATGGGGSFVLKAGDTMAGALTINAGPFPQLLLTGTANPGFRFTPSSGGTVEGNFIRVGDQFWIGNGTLNFPYFDLVSGAILVAPSPPQGRLTLQTATPVMSTTQAAKTTIFYTPYVGNKVPIYDGTSMAMTTFAEISTTTTDTTKNEGAIVANSNYDWFVWNDAGTVRLCHGPFWTNATTRSAGTALVMVGGILLNNASITNACAAQRGTYVGTTRSNASAAQVDWIYATASGTPGFFGVWNCYNRVSVASLWGKSGTWTYGTVTWRGWGGAATIPFTAVFGLAEDAIDVAATIIVDAPTAGGTAWMAISLDSAGGPASTGLYSDMGSIAGRFALHARHVSTQFGTHTWYGVEQATGITFTFRGTVDGDGTGITFIARM